MFYVLMGIACVLYGAKSLDAGNDTEAIIFNIYAVMLFLTSIITAVCTSAKRS